MNYFSNDTDYVGDTIALNRVDRKQMGSYLCIASNDVPPAVSKRITLRYWIRVTTNHLLVKSNLCKTWQQFCKIKLKFWEKIPRKNSTGNSALDFGIQRFFSLNNAEASNKVSDAWFIVSSVCSRNDCPL